MYVFTYMLQWHYILCTYMNMFHQTTLFNVYYLLNKSNYIFDLFDFKAQHKIIFHNHLPLLKLIKFQRRAMAHKSRLWTRFVNRMDRKIATLTWAAKHRHLIARKNSSFNSSTSLIKRKLIILIVLRKYKLCWSTITNPNDFDEKPKINWLRQRWK